jgi:hypothetical protein
MLMNKKWDFLFYFKKFCICESHEQQAHLHLGNRGTKPLEASVLHNKSQHYPLRHIEFLPFGPSIWLKGGQHLPKHMG